jgi:enamine deaminase RidA (YjgF/YER057c/UK114 family)
MSIIQRLNPTPRYAEATVFERIVHLVEVPESEEGDIGEQTQSLLRLLEHTLGKVGSSKSHLLMATVYLTDMADYDGFNAAWEAWLPFGSAPSRACVKVAGLAKPGWKVEIAAVAAKI